MPNKPRLRLPGKPLATGAEMTGLNEQADRLATPQGMFNELVRCLQNGDKQVLEGFIREANSLIGKSVNNKPYIFAEFLWFGLAWGTGFVLGRMCKDDWFGHLEISEVSARAEKVFVPLSLILAFLFNEESRRYTANYTEWGRVLSALRERVMFVYYRIKHKSDEAQSRPLSPQEKFPIAKVAAASALLITSMKMSGIRNVQKQHSVGSKLDAIYKQYTAKPAEVYTDEGNVHIPALWNGVIKQYDKYLPRQHFSASGPDEEYGGVYGEFDLGVIQEAGAATSSLTCPTIDRTFHIFLWFSAVLITAAFVWDATEGLGDEIFQSVSVLLMLYLPYLLSAAAHMGSYHESSHESVFWTAFGGPMRALLRDTHTLIHEHTWNEVSDM